MRIVIVALAFILSGLLPSEAAVTRSLIIRTKYCGTFTVRTSDCDEINREAYIRSACFPRRGIALFNVNGVYYCHCGLGSRKEVVDLLWGLYPSMSGVYHWKIHDKYPCRGIDRRFR
jgi:hypothetical protein